MSFFDATPCTAFHRLHHRRVPDHLVHQHGHTYDDFAGVWAQRRSWSVRLVEPDCPVRGALVDRQGLPDAPQIRSRDMYLLTTASWVVVCAFAALPMVFIRHISYTDAFFETMSGITTTGSTVLTGLDSASPGLLIWRSLLHWLGESASSVWLWLCCHCCV